jgi:hypothetical protein
MVVLGVTSGVIVADEVLMTRLLSVVTWYGMAFFTVAFLAVFVLGPPLLRARRKGAALPDGGAAVYFAMLGAGFMLVELALMQRLHVVLGHPTYALVVVLVVGSILSVLIAIVFGIAASFFVAAVVYLIAAAAGPHRWRVPTPR